MFRREPRCSFCGRAHREVGKLVSGPRVYICDECVTLAQRVIDGTDDRPRRPYTGPATVGDVMAKVLRRILGRGTHHLASSRS